ncbi:hypothetical protein CTI12_AA037070 [Artemisia annua]|uniref:DUF4216 domain-containing protein n=1 Tax=Artemisia annua TaxID=35608 RepID=A0A2U1QF90_ARTAN|nr:hypothetical protein CTI12_AA037070 [Artemisia annua]
MKKVIWYVLHNSSEIDAYMNEFQSERPDSDMQQEFPRWFELKIGNLYTAKDPRCTPDLFALACGPLSTATSINSCVVNGVKFVVHSRDVKRTTQNSGICSPGEKPEEMYYAKDPRCTPDLFALACGPLSTATSINSCVVNGVKFVVHSRDVKRTTQNRGICSPGEKPEEMHYGQLEDILEFSYTHFKVVLFRVKWFDLAKRDIALLAVFDMSQRAFKIHYV